jgi:hypothetical protein
MGTVINYQHAKQQSINYGKKKSPSSSKLREVFANDGIPLLALAIIGLLLGLCETPLLEEACEDVCEPLMHAINIILC